MNSEVLMSIGFFILVTAIISYFSYKQKQSSWQGEVIKKRSHYDDESLRTTYRLIFRTNEGKKKRMQVTKTVYEKFEVGQKVNKEKGEYLPKKV